jgi:hypothetical protein
LLKFTSSVAFFDFVFFHGEFFGWLESMVHSPLHCVDICFPRFQTKQMAFPHHTMLVIEDYQPWDWLEGGTTCQVTREAVPTPTKHDTYQVYASGGSGEDYLGTSSC